MTTRKRATSRRTLSSLTVAGGGVGWLTFVAMTLAQHPYHWAGLLALAVFGACWILSRSLIGDIAERRVVEIDEYELDQRNTARNAGYVAALAAMIVLFVYFTVAVQLADRGTHGALDQAPPLVFSAFLLAGAVPSFLLTWRLRTQINEIEEGEP